MIIISNGHDKFILAPLASELAKEGILSLFITGFYPTPLIKNIIGNNPFAIKKLHQLLLREEPGIPVPLIRAKIFSEILSKIGRLIGRILKSSLLEQQLLIFSFKYYAKSAKNDIRFSNAKIYHYRSGFGLSSVKVAKEAGMITICDHSIANPEIIDFLIENNGQWPDSKISLELSPFWKAILVDIKQADYIIVNSDFVKETFIRYGWKDTRIFVNYTGIDDQFLESIPSRERNLKFPKSRLLFAGDFSKRKGGEVLFNMIALLSQPNWEMEFIASISPEMKFAADKLQKSDNIIFYGLLPRKELATHLVNADIFIFPSLAEGSARVIFMALACGCYVITTANSGSIVKDGVHGKIVKAGDSYDLFLAVDWAIKHPNKVAEIGQSNALLFNQNYHQSSYGQETIKLYKKFLLSRYDIEV